jgi:hypothetical protein
MQKRRMYRWNRHKLWRRSRRWWWFRQYQLEQQQQLTWDIRSIRFGHVLSKWDEHLAGQTAYRYQVNLSSKEQLDLQGNDGNTEATIGLGITFKEKPTTSGTAYFSKSRFPGETSDSVNFYMSMFVNTGHEYEGENFLSPSTEKIDYTIENGVFSATIPTLEMILESDQTTKVTLNSGVLELDW